MKKKKQSNLKSYTRRASSIDWYMPKHINTCNEVERVKVCKTFFLNTLGISDKMISTAHKNQTAIGICADDQRGKHGNRPNKIAHERLNNVRQHISSFQVVESHYCRKDSDRLYLQPGLSLSKMYLLYKEKCILDDISPVTSCKYRDIFKNDFNLSFFRPKKDRCDLCCKYKNSSADQKQILEQELVRHQQNKNLSMAQKEQDKFMAKSNPAGSTCVCCFDLEQILMTPHGFQSCLFYKRRLSSFNFTIYDMASSDGSCYLWNECIAKRGACEIASCIFKFIMSKAEQGMTDFIFYSDNCVAQNKNRFYVTMLWYCLHKFNLKSIVHRYLEKGHTQNEGDTIHASIENASRNIQIYTTDQWATLIRTACHKNPYTVHQMTLRDFLDFKKLSGQIRNFDLNTENEKVYWNAIKVLKIHSSSPDYFQYKTDHDGPDFTVNLFHRSRSSNPDPKQIQISQLRDEFLPIAN